MRVVVGGVELGGCSGLGSGVGGAVGIALELEECVGRVLMFGSVVEVGIGLVGSG